MLQAKAERADNFLKSRGFNTCQINGQRISVSKDADRKPEPYSEVYAGKIPREIFEDDLLPRFQEVGPIYKIRLMMDFSGTNRGFAYITYMTAADAKEAVRRLHNIRLHEADPTKILVLLSFDNKGLLFLGLPANCSKQVLLKCLKEKLRDVVNVKLLPAKGPDRGAEVYFKSHEAACNARRLLVPGSVKILDCVVTVDWAKPLLKQSINEHSDAAELETLIDQNNNLMLDKNVPQQPRSILQPSSMRLSNGVVPNYQPTPLSPDNILGARAQAILRGCSDFDQRFLIVRNINLKELADEKIHMIFELSGRLQVLSILHLGEEVAAIEYANVDQTLFMLETVVLVPDCFSKLAVPGRTLSAYLSSLASLAEHIPRGYSITHF